MLINYIKIAFRNIVRHKVYSIINILGLAIGMACAILLLLFVHDELSYDKYNSKYKRIYMIQTRIKIAGVEVKAYGYETPLLLGQAFKAEYPAIEDSIRVYPNRMVFLNNKGEAIGESGICLADPAIFKVFDFNFIYGSPDSALDSPHSIVLNKTLAKKYFGEQDPVGKVLSANNGVGYIVKGVFEDLPRNSSKPYKALISMQDLSEAIGVDMFKEASNSYTSIYFPIYTYILLSENSRIEDIIKDRERFREKYIAKSFTSPDDEFEVMFQRLDDAYLYSRPYPNSPVNVLQRVYILSALAMVILIIACINYINLATARSAGRAREVGVRKVLGADRPSIIKQFLCESIIITIMGILIALVLIELFLPDFNNIVGKELSFSATGDITLFSGILIITLFVGLMAGSYPAFLLSSFSPVKVLRGILKSGADKGMLRKILVVFQYTIAVIMIICTILLMKQMSYIQNMDLGFNKKDILYVELESEEEQRTIPAFKENLLKYSGILAAARSNETAGGLSLFSISCEVEDPNGKVREKLVSLMITDYDFIDLMGMKVLEGRSFDREIGSDKASAVLVNKTLVKEMGWSDTPIGKRIKWNDGERKVIGVLKDFQFQSLNDKIMPTIIILGEEISTSVRSNLSVLSIKIRPEDQNTTLEFVKKKWLEFNPKNPIEIRFLEDLFKMLYRTDKTTSLILSYSAFLGIFISCLGLFGLSSFIAENKTKEIGVRKVFGASVGSIVSKLSLNFLTLVVIASIIACPIAYYAMSKWHENFAYKTEISWWVFVGAGCIALLIALATVSYHAVKAALTDPVKALRYE